MKIVALVLAGGEGSRLYPLTAEHAKPALPFANGYRIVDFVLSNLVNSKISTIYVLAQYKPESLMRHIAAAWAPLFADEGAIKVLLPRSNTFDGQFKGTADAVYQYLDLLQAHSADVVAVFAADHVYRMDVRQMVDFHCAREADVSVSAVEACDVLYQAKQKDSIAALGMGIWLAVTFPVDPELTVAMLIHVVDETPNDSDGAAVAAITARYVVDLRADDDKHESQCF